MFGDSEAVPMAAVEGIDEDTLLYLLDRLQSMGRNCKCGDGRSILLCPNYVPGDEEELDDDE